MVEIIHSYIVRVDRKLMLGMKVAYKYVMIQWSSRIHEYLITEFTVQSIYVVFSDISYEDWAGLRNEDHLSQFQGQMYISLHRSKRPME